MRGFAGRVLLVLKSAEHSHVGQQSHPNSLSRGRCSNYLSKRLFFALCREWPVLVKEAVLTVTHCSVTQSPGFSWDRVNFPPSSSWVLDSVREECW